MIINEKQFLAVNYLLMMWGVLIIASYVRVIISSYYCATAPLQLIIISSSSVSKQRMFVTSKLS